MSGKKKVIQKGVSKNEYQKLCESVKPTDLRCTCYGRIMEVSDEALRDKFFVAKYFCQECFGIFKDLKKVTE